MEPNVTVMNEPGPVVAAAMPQDCGPYRQSAVGILRRRVEALGREMACLTRLADFVETLPPGDPAEEALWQMLMNSARQNSPW